LFRTGSLWHAGVVVQVFEFVVVVVDVVVVDVVVDVISTLFVGRDGCCCCRLYQ